MKSFLIPNLAFLVKQKMKLKFFNMEEQKTLLEKAKDLRMGRSKKPKPSKQDIELVLAWVHDEISLTQLARVKSEIGGNIYPFITNTLKEILLEKEKQ